MSIKRLKELVSRKDLGFTEDEVESEANKHAQHAEKQARPKVSPAFMAALFAMGMTVTLVTFGGVGAPAAAESINTTAIIEMISSMTSIFPSMGDMVVAIVPTLLVLAIVGFLLGFFDSILDAIQGAMRIIRR